MNISLVLFNKTNINTQALKYSNNKTLIVMLLINIINNNIKN